MCLLLKEPILNSSWSNCTYSPNQRNLISFSFNPIPMQHGREVIGACTENGSTIQHQK